MTSDLPGAGDPLGAPPREAGTIPGWGQPTAPGQPVAPGQPMASGATPAPEQANPSPLATPWPRTGQDQPLPPGQPQPAPWGRPAWAPPVDGSDGRLPSARRAIAVIVVLLIVFSAGIGVGRLDTTTTGTSASAIPSGLPPEFATYLEAWKDLQDHYVDPSALDPKALVYGSIEGLVNAVGDTSHTRFLTPADLANEHTELSGSIVGIGAVMSTDQTSSTIQSVIPGGPADRAGLRSGDHILSVDGVSTTGLSVDAVVTKIRGDAGTTVRLSVLHAGAATPVQVSIVREKVSVPAVSWAMVPGTKVADIRLEEFSTGSAADLTKAIAAAKKASATSIVLDLRGNPGGYVDQAVAIASQFIKDGAVYEERDRTGSTKPVDVKSGGTATTTPLAVLVDNGTASAAEIVAGAIQDAGRGEIIGKTTFGTGTVLSEYDLKDGSALLIGTVEWLTRDGRQIWKHGIVPDIDLDSNPVGKIVTPSELTALGAGGLASSGDAQLLRAVALLKSA